jgi:diguanylate cyclase (GGDEF)-like protein
MLELGRLRQITASMASMGAPQGTLKLIMNQALQLARGTSCVILVSRKQLRAMYGREEAERGEVDLGQNISVVSDGPVAEQIMEWEGATEPVVSDDGTLLILPLASGGLAIQDPVTDAILNHELRDALQVLADLVGTTTGIASRLAEARQRSVAQEKLRQKLHEQNILLRELAVVDELTGLYNRRFFDRRLAYEFERFSRYEHDLSVMIFDLDHFKRVNDTYGHGAGDEVLRHLARLVQETVRKVDIFCRYGGEEFAVLMPDTPREGAQVASERIRTLVEAAPAVVDNVEIRFTISAGVATTRPGFDGDAAALVRAADQALYKAKLGGRNQIQIADVSASEPGAQDDDARGEAVHG